MTNEELIAKIKAAIERRKGYISVTHFAEELLSFLSTLEPEKPMNLEEEISRTYHDGSVTDTSDLDHNSYENIARHFAQWGAEWQKEQMMKEAVEGEIVKDISNKLAVTAKINLDGFKFGDKVRVIVLKKEG